MSRLVTPANVRRLLRARDRVHDGLDERVTVAELARVAGLSPSFFHRAFTEAFGVTPHAYVRRERIQRAKVLLAGGASVTEVCADVGFESLGSFSALFSRVVGVSPRAYQLRARRTLPVPGQLASAFVPWCFFLAYADPAHTPE